MIDLAGATLLPGLVDTHVHLAFDASADPVGGLARRGDAEVVQAMARAGRAALRGGVTTVRDLGDRGYLSLELRGRPGLPTIVAAGPPITTPGGHCHYLGGAAAPVPMPGVGGPPPAVAARRPRIIANTQRLYEAGASMVAGTDAGVAPMKPHDVVRYAPPMLRQLGFGPAEALRAITSAAAGVCGLGHCKGRIAPGFDADILAVDGDPVADPDALHHIRAVYARGLAVQGAGYSLLARGRLPEQPAPSTDTASTTSQRTPDALPMRSMLRARSW